MWRLPKVRPCPPPQEGFSTLKGADAVYASGNAGRGQHDYCSHSEGRERREYPPLGNIPAAVSTRTLVNLNSLSPRRHLASAGMHVSVSNCLWRLGIWR